MLSGSRWLLKLRGSSHFGFTTYLPWQKTVGIMGHLAGCHLLVEGQEGVGFAGYPWRFLDWQ